MGLKGLMIAPVDSLKPGTSVMEACRLMDEKKVGALAVVEDRNSAAFSRIEISSAESCSPSVILTRTWKGHFPPDAPDLPTPARNSDMASPEVPHDGPMSSSLLWYEPCPMSKRRRTTGRGGSRTKRAGSSPAPGAGGGPRHQGGKFDMLYNPILSDRPVKRD